MPARTMPLLRTGYASPTFGTPPRLAERLMQPQVVGVIRPHKPQHSRTTLDHAPRRTSSRESPRHVTGDAAVQQGTPGTGTGRATRTSPRSSCSPSPLARHLVVSFSAPRAPHRPTAARHPARPAAPAAALFAFVWLHHRCGTHAPRVASPTASSCEASEGGRAGGRARARRSSACSAEALQGGGEFLESSRVLSNVLWNVGYW
jgi:hypothetical protein